MPPSYLPLLLLPLPLSLSPIHLILLLSLTYILNRPCIYCSFLLIVLFASSCHWSNRCFFDLPSFSSSEDAANTIAAWFTPRLYTTGPSAGAAHGNGTVAEEMSGFLTEVAQSTVVGLATAVKESATGMFAEARHKVIASTASTAVATAMAASSTPAPSLVDTGIGTHWLRHLLGRSEWTLPCVGVKLVL